MKTAIFLAFTIISTLSIGQTYHMPAETDLHEGTWLQWPHNHLYGPFYRSDLEDTWTEMTRELVQGEKVFIIAYDSTEYNYIVSHLTGASVPLTNIQFFIHQNDDCWVRDNGPIFVFDTNDSLHLLDWGFNGWGNSTPYALCDVVPQGLSTDIGVPRVDLSAVVLEGGAIEIDGYGTLMATRSSIVNTNRNPGLSEAQIETYLFDNLGATNIIWLDGVAGLEITDMHIDGFVKFHDSVTIVTMDSADLIYWDVPPADIDTIFNAKNANGDPYNFVHLPLTVNDVVTTWNENLGVKGSYVNYYVGNDVVLVPTYNDPNDNVAISILQGIYQGRTVVGIDVRNLYYGGGMVHCVTQQQPYVDYMGVGFKPEPTIRVGQVYPNPFTETAQITFQLTTPGNVVIDIYNEMGQKVLRLLNRQLPSGPHNVLIDAENLAAGLYTCQLSVDGGAMNSIRIMLSK